MVYNWIKFIPKTVYPPRCLLCGAGGHEGLDLCRECWSELPHNHHCCQRCALPLPLSAGAAASCGACRKNRPAFDHCLTPLLYRSPLDRLISDLKFGNRLLNGRLLAGLLTQHLMRAPTQMPEIIIPVPLHPSRLRQRGYNQALELARPLSNHFSIPLDYRSCIRHKATDPQMDLEKSSRRKNVRGAFLMKHTIQARHVTLVDDVITTGATVSELARILKRGGVQRVDVWAVARTP